MDLTKKTRFYNPQALFNLMRILQEYLINKTKLFAIMLLPLDLAVASALLISHTERIISYRVVNRFLQYLRYDLSYVKEIYKMILDKDYVSETLTEKIDEKELGGTVYRHIQRIIKFIWSFFILMLVLPILPILWVYDFLIPKIIIGFLYYIIMFWKINLFLQIYIFIVATFLVASTTVPFLFKIFVYVKHLFELKKRSFAEIKLEAETFFIKLYKYNFDEESEKIEEEEEEVSGGLYYLFLKLLHGIKDKFIKMFSLRIKKIAINKSSSTKGIEGLEGIKEKIDQIKSTIISHNENHQKIKISQLIGPLIAFIFTFIIGSFLVFGGSKGQGLLGSFVLSIINPQRAEIIWSNFNGTHIGYLTTLVKTNLFIPRFTIGFAKAIDTIFNYLFIAWHEIYPIYIKFIIGYYSIIFKLFGFKFNTVKSWR